MGDSGICWDGGKFDKYIQSWYEKKNFTTLSIRGNHDNADVISHLPIVEKWGGKVRQVTPHVFYTITGEVYDIAGYKCLAINGADSHDKAIRKVGRDWWPQEAITSKQMADTIMGLIDRDIKKVDFIFTHTGGPFIARTFGFTPSPSDEELYKVLALRYTGKFQYNVHYCGHYHCDKWIFNDAHCLYNTIYEIIDGKERRIKLL